MPHPALHRERGAATLVVVLALFFIMALAAAYTTRNLVFEQRIANNNLRASQAFETAEAGIDWAIGMLGQGRVDASCQPTADAGANTFRQRYLAQDANGRFSVPLALAALRPSCVMAGGNYSCSCPAAGAAAALPANAGGPAFQVRFIDDPAITRPGVIRVESRGCNAQGTPCDPAAGQAADAEATVSVLLALSPALAEAPHAALTVRTALDLGGGATSLANTAEGGSGVALAAGGGLYNGSAVQLQGPAGAPAGASVMANDTRLAALSPQRLFVALFGVDLATYQHQPAVARVACSSDCSSTLLAAAAANPGRVVWVPGDLSLNQDVSLGSPTEPVLLVVEGDITAAADFRVQGLVYQRGSRLVAAGALTRIQGALVAENSLTVTGAPSVVYDANVLARLSQQGSLVRAPGGWRDFTPR